MAYRYGDRNQINLFPLQNPSFLEKYSIFII